ncbi:hypothetical protein L9F63_011417, partial [Diploptera punctata]
EVVELTMEEETDAEFLMLVTYGYVSSVLGYQVISGSLLVLTDYYTTKLTPERKSFSSSVAKLLNLWKGLRNTQSVESFKITITWWS